MHYYQSVLTIIGLSFFSNALLAQAEDTLKQCSTIDSPEARLICYDSAANRQVLVNEVPAKSPPPSAAAPVNADIAASTNMSIQVEEFGNEQIAVVIQNEQGEQELFDTVIELREIQPGRLRIVLASGQVWRQTSAKRFHLTAGDEVRLFESRWGGDYRLAIQGRAGYIQVSRLK